MAVRLKERTRDLFFLMRGISGLGRGPSSCSGILPPVGCLTQLLCSRLFLALRDRVTSVSTSYRKRPRYVDVAATLPKPLYLNIIIFNSASCFLHSNWKDVGKI